MGQKVRELGKCEIFGTKCEEIGKRHQLSRDVQGVSNMIISQISHI